MVKHISNKTQICMFIIDMLVYNKCMLVFHTLECLIECVDSVCVRLSDRTTQSMGDKLIAHAMFLHL